jgi:probable selenium-dependent hydroxylase accessory protein YqeC
MNIQEALALGHKGVISIVGAGGKTSLMYALARELAAAGKRVLTTTTTRIVAPTREQSPAAIVHRTAGEIVEKAELLLDKHYHLTAASEYLEGGNKLKGLESSAIQYIVQSDLFDFIVIEADGAARRSLKACAPHEPVVPTFSDRVVAMAGLDAVAKPLMEEWVFRSTIFSRNTGLEPLQEITEASIASAIIHDMASVSVTGEKAMKIAFLNKADNLKAIRAGERIAACIEKNGSTVFHRTVIGELRADPLIHRCNAVQRRRIR